MQHVLAVLHRSRGSRDAGFTDEERNAFRRYIWGNILEAIKAICEAVDAAGEAANVVEQEAFELIMKTQINEGKA